MDDDDEATLRPTYNKLKWVRVCACVCARAEEVTLSLRGRCVLFTLDQPIRHHQMEVEGLMRKTSFSNRLITYFEIKDRRVG